MASSATRAMSWLLAPQVEDGPRSHAIAAVGLRLLAGLLWLYNVSWKRAPDFGQDDDKGLYHFTALAVSDPVFGPYSWVVENLVLPNFIPFGWVVLAAETTLAVLLLSGAFVRLAAALGVAQSVAIGLSVALAPNEWPWSYAMMVGIHLVLLFSASGRFLSVDAYRAGIDDGRRLALTWGGVALVGGIIAVALSVGDPLDPSGPSLRAGAFPVGIGTYNLLGGAVLLIVGALLGGWARSAKPGLALGAAVVAAVAALSLYAQLGFSDPILGGSATSAALYLTLATVAVALALTARRASRDDQPTPTRPTKESLSMELSSRIDPVLSVTRESAREVDATPRYPVEAVDALRASGLLGLTLPEEVGGLGGGPTGAGAGRQRAGERLRLDGDGLPDACQRGHDGCRRAPGGLARHAALAGRRSRAGNPGVLRDGFAVALLGTGVAGPTQR